MDMLLSAVDHGSAQYPGISLDDSYQDASFEEDPDDPAVADPAAPSANEVTHERWTKTPRPRGRHAKDPHAEYVRFDCKDVDELETSLREYLEAPTAPAEHATLEFHFPIHSAFMVYTRDFKRDPTTLWTPAEPTDLMRKTAVSVIEVLQPTEEPKAQIVRQKAVARTIVEAIQRADGFKYSFHNNWLSREDQAHRFSFFCNDSTLNKGRAANGGAGTEGKEKKKAVYDCRGLIAVKFSVTKNNLEVHYRHVPLHKTFAERAPAPRRDSKRRKMMEIMDPEAVKRQEESKEQRKKGRPRKARLEKEKRPQKKRMATAAGEGRGEALQPLVDFLGSADRHTPRNGVHEASSDDEDGGIQLNDEADDSSRAASAPAFPANKRKDLTSGSRPGSKTPKRVKTTHEPGTLTWGRDKTSESYAHDAQGRAIDRDPKSSAALERSQKAATKQRKKPASADGPSAPVSELEALKQKLAAATQRLEALESEKRVPVNPPYPPYPPYGYGWPPYPYPPPYPCPPPPPHHYAPAPASQGAQRGTQSAAQPMYPGGPPHPNVSRTTHSTPVRGAEAGVDGEPASKELSIEQSVKQSAPEAVSSSHNDPQVEVSPATDSPEQPPSQPAAPLTQPDVRPASDTASLQSSAPRIITPSAQQPTARAQRASPLAAALAASTPPTIAQPVMGVLVPEGQRRARRNEHVTHTFHSGAPVLRPDDSRMKSLFNDAIAAIAGPNPVQAMKSATTYNARNAAKATKTPHLTSQSQDALPPPPPNSGYIPGHYPAGYPWPPPPYPYAAPYPGNNTMSTVVLPPPPSQQPHYQPGGRPPPGYDELRAQMMAHAQTTPSLMTTGKASEKIKKPVEFRFESDVSHVKKARNAKPKGGSSDKDNHNSAVDDQRKQNEEVVHVSTDSSRSVSVETAPERAEQAVNVSDNESEDVTSEEE